MVLVLTARPTVVVSRVPRELYVLVHAEVVLDVLLHIDVTEARSYVRPVPMVVVLMRVAGMMGRLVLSSLQGRDLAWLLLGQRPLQH